jgi:hypothetical protein
MANINHDFASDQIACTRPCALNHIPCRSYETSASFSIQRAAFPAAGGADPPQAEYLKPHGPCRPKVHSPPISAPRLLARFQHKQTI